MHDPWKTKPVDPTTWTDADWEEVIEAERHQSNMSCMHQVDALLKADWKFMLSNRDLELWQWQWRRPPKRKGSQGRLFLSTNQAYRALMKEQGKDPGPHC